MVGGGLAAPVAVGAPLGVAAVGAEPVDFTVALLVAAPPSKDAEPASLWTASAAAYDAFVKERGAELDAAVEAGVVYAPKDTGFILCAIPPEDGTTEHGYLVAKRSANAATNMNINWIRIFFNHI